MITLREFLNLNENLHTNIIILDRNKQLVYYDPILKLSKKELNRIYETYGVHVMNSTILSFYFGPGAELVVKLDSEIGNSEVIEMSI